MCSREGGHKLNMIFPQETMKQERTADIISMTGSSPYGIIIIII
jgi:hypothetical protein